MDIKDVMDNIYDLMFNNKEQDEEFMEAFDYGYIEGRTVIHLPINNTGREFVITIKEQEQ